MKRIINPLLVAALGSFCLVGSASAAEMTGAQIKEFLTGKTIYLDLNTAGSVGGQRAYLCSTSLPMAQR